MSTEVFGLAFDCVPSFSSGEVVSKRVRVQSRSSEASRRETLTGSLPVCMLFRKTKGSGRGGIPLLVFFD